MDSDGLVEYFLKWKGYSDEENTWEPLENVETEEIIIEYEKKNKGSVFSRLGSKKESDEQETKIESIENGKDNGEISKDTTTTTTTNDDNKSDQSSEEKFNVDGVVFQFNSKAILFEFTIPERDAEYIGEIKTQTLKLNKSDEGKSIPNDVTDEDIGNYIHVGDELKCLVKQVRKSTKKISNFFFVLFNKNSVKFQSSTLETFSYEEEQEEIGNDGDIQKANK